MGMAFESFPVNRNLPDCCHLSKTVEGTLAMTSASCFSTLGCFPSGIWDLCVSRWVKWYRTLFFFYTLLTFPFATDAHTPHFAFLVFSWWFQFQLTFGFPDSVPTRAGNTFVLLLPPDVPPAVLHLSSDRSSMFTHAGLLPCLLVFLHAGKDRSSALRRLSLKISQLSCTPLLPEAVSHWDAAKQVHEEAKSCFSEVQDYNFAVSLGRFP